MREILFRGKRFDNKGWVQGSLLAEGTRVEIIRGSCNNVGIEGVDVIPETIGQFTGLLDKNGNKIFEGDIINGYNSNGEKYIENSAVEWSDLFVAWNVNGYISLYGCNIYFYEVIGNIHDNPELLRTPQNDEVRE